MTKKVKPTGGNGKKTFSTTALQMALLHVFDMMDAAHIQFVVLGAVSKCLYDNNENLKADKIVIGVKEGELSKYALSTIKSFYADEVKKEDYGFSLSFENVPIHIKVLKKHFEFIERPDTRFVLAETLPIPNPFMDYWNRRMQI